MVAICPIMVNDMDEGFSFQKHSGKERELYAQWEAAYARMLACMTPLGFVADGYLRILRRLSFRREDIRHFFEMDPVTHEAFLSEIDGYAEGLAPLIEGMRSLWFDVSNDAGLSDWFRRGDTPLDWQAGGYFVPGLKDGVASALPASSVVLLERYCDNAQELREYLMMFPLDADYLELVFGKVQERLEEYLELQDYVERLRKHGRDQGCGGGTLDFFEEQLYLTNATMQITRSVFQVFPGDVAVFCKEIGRLRKLADGCRDTLFLGSRYLAEIQARKYWSRVRVPTVSKEDLFQEGCIGLHRALSRFQYRRGSEFAAYASFFVKQSVKDFLATFSGTARLPIHQAKQWHGIRAFKSRFFQTKGRMPTHREISDACGVPMDLARDLETVGVQAASLDMPVGECGEESLLGILPGAGADPRIEAENADKREFVMRMLSELREKDRELLTAFYGLGGARQVAMKDIAAKRGVTSEAVRQQIEKAKETLRLKLKGRPEARVFIEAFRDV